MAVNGRVIATKSAGDSFGEMALLSRDIRRADVTAIVGCDLAILRRSEYLEIAQMKQNAKMALKLQLLRANPLFACLDDAQRKTFANIGRVENYAGGEAIIHQVRAGTHVFVRKLAMPGQRAFAIGCLALVLAPCYHLSSRSRFVCMRHSC